ncbi:hypothetical protein DB30_03637 [Enhygromyxa salina]|uniref:Uncharacterized protein n=1 Tax=Enhygromyxa salina TaxID=215803 RepID=A0A0C2D5T0_9BACT|nr:hypothetical protein [Enhygromyxa salina]KIG17040.1 hypothetical protein DB30_03637 [Enhygromyxa salina]
MFEENRHYGHAHLLLSYCGLSPRTQIPVRLQHGWQPGVGMRPQDMAQPGPKIVWSSRNLARAREAGYRGAVAIGAPWLYMPRAPDPGPDHPRSVLIVPFHGWEKQALAGTMDDYAQALVRLEAAGFGPITVCLYWFEYEQPALREVFERHGFATTTMGARGDNPAFLQRQRELIQRHAYVSSNRVSTAAFYALEAGRPFFLYGPLAGLSATEDASGEQFDQWQRDEFPSLAAVAADAVCNVELGAYELGAEHKRTPEQLRELLLLGADQRGARLTVGLRRRAHDLGVALGLGRRP